MAQFMLLLHENPAEFEKVSPEEMQAIIVKYQSWSRRLEASGKLAGGMKLKDEGGRNLSARHGKLSVSDGPYAEAKEVIGGYFTIEAADYDEAVSLASDCPHLAHGRIELRQVDIVK